MAIEKTTNRSDRDIDKKFNMVEFNKIFEQNNLVLDKKNIFQQKTFKKTKLRKLHVWIKKIPHFSF